MEGLCVPGLGWGGAGQGMNSERKEGIEAFDVGGIDDARDALSGLARVRDGFDAALDNTVVHVQNAIKALFDHWRDSDIEPDSD